MPVDAKQPGGLQFRTGLQHCRDRLRQARRVTQRTQPPLRPGAQFRRVQRGSRVRSAQVGHQASGGVRERRFGPAERLRGALQAGRRREGSARPGDRLDEAGEPVSAPGGVGDKQCAIRSEDPGEQDAIGRPRRPLHPEQQLIHHLARVSAARHERYPGPVGQVDAEEGGRAPRRPGLPGAQQVQDDRLAAAGGEAQPARVRRDQGEQRHCRHRELLRLPGQRPGMSDGQVPEQPPLLPDRLHHHVIAAQRQAHRGRRPHGVQPSHRALQVPRRRSLLLRPNGTYLTVPLQHRGPAASQAGQPPQHP
jgi:hypothetical protein